MAAARKRRARASSKPARKAARRKPRRTTTTITTTKVVRSNPRRARRRRNPASVAALKRRRDRLQVAAARRIDVGWKRGQTPAEIKRTADRIRALDRADEILQRRTRKRRNPTMAKKKRSAAQRRAFRKMLAGLKRHKARKNPGRKRRGRARRRKTTITVTNPRRRRRKNSRGGSIMAKRRRRRTRTNPGRRHHRRRNPHRRHHRRRNPGGGGMVSIVKSTIAAAIPSMATGGLMALVDSKVFKDKAMGVQVVAKLGIAAGAGYFLRNRPRTAALVMGAVMGGVAYQLVAQAAGGVVAPDKQDAAKKMAALVYQDRRMASLVNQNGTLRTQPSLSGMGQTMGDGGTALPTMPIYDPVNLG